MSPYPGYADDEEHRVDGFVETGYFENHVAQQGGRKIFAFRVLRLLGCLALLGLSIPTISINATVPLTFVSLICRSDYSIRLFMLPMKALYILIGDRLCNSE